MALVTIEFLAAPISILEQYGVNLRTINYLENKLQFIWIQQLQGVTEQQLLDARWVGVGAVKNLKEGLERFRVETVRRARAKARRDQRRDKTALLK